MAAACLRTFIPDSVLTYEKNQYVCRYDRKVFTAEAWEQAVFRAVLYSLEKQ